MRILEPHIHMYSRVTDDYEAMALAGVRVVVEPAFWLGQPRTHVATFIDYFGSILEFEAGRAANFGIQHYATIALNPKEANDPRVCDAVIAELPRFLKHPRCVAVGEVGFDSNTPAEERALRKQIELAVAHKLPVMVHTPHRDKLRGTEWTIRVLKEMKFPVERCLIDHSTEETTKLILENGFYCGHTVYPNTKLSAERFANLVDEFGPERMMVNSSADWGASDALSVPKVVLELRRRGYADDVIERIVWRNPVAFYSQSGKLVIPESARDAAPAKNGAVKAAAAPKAKAPARRAR